MLAFMLISAVSFSAYMRYSRLPSSFLRRSSASRMLAKAALAEAIDEIDGAIGNNPHPGVGTRMPRRGVGSLSADLDGIQNEDMRTRNTWLHHVYIGTNAVSEADLNNKLVDPDETVSTLTLEGLAYIPPAMVNEARYYSRRSRAGIWKNLGFDAGRYAFCAIDVSDQFDVNLLSAKVPRNSSPSGRISLAYLFESGEEHTSSGQDPKGWDNFLEKDAKVRQNSSAELVVSDAGKGQNVSAQQNDAYVPFVSVADFNLALHDKKPLGWESPFGKFIENGGDFYNGAGVTDPTGSSADKVKRMSFVADSHFPSSASARATRATDLCDISNFDEQPFTLDDLTLENFPVERLVDNPAYESARRIADKTSFFGLAALYDYLDANNVPVSLAMPSVERAPMICGISAVNMANSKLAIKKETNETTPPDGAAQFECERTYTYFINGEELSKFIDDGSFKVTLAYPFRRGVDLLDPTAPFKFTLEGQLSVFLAREGAIGFRSGGGSLSPSKNLFTDPANVNNGNNGVLRIPLKFDFTSATFDNVMTDDSAVRNSDAIISMSNAKGVLMEYLEQNPLLTVRWKWLRTRNEETRQYEPLNPPGDPEYAQSSLSVVTPGGNAEALNDFLGNRQEKLVVASALWLRVKNDNDKTVDLVPAALADDDALNNANNANAAIIADIVGRDPLMLVTANAGNPLLVSCNDLEAASGSGGTPINLDFTMNVQCIDPRWNWAPEHWYRSADPVTKDTWLTAVRNFVNKDGRDRDIFLATSDAGYLQSVYELAFLPRFTDLQNYGNDQVCGNMERLNGTFNDFETSPELVRNRGMMWRSYHPYATDAGADRDPFEELRIVNDGGGFRINPYSKDLNVLMGAFANTPVDWWAASTTTEENGQANGRMQYLPQSDKLDAKQFNQEFAFSAMNADAKVKWKGLESIAKRFQDLVRQRIQKKGDATVAETWMDVFDGVEYSGRPTGSEKDPNKMSKVEELDVNESLDWDNESMFCGVNTSELLDGGDKLYDVDRKFLYGFWRECFAAKQQLFLVFVRAEPAMMGGGAAGQTPPQLGARAVALVWRDPTKSPDEMTPHRTRVLFYRQFD